MTKKRIFILSATDKNTDFLSELRLGGNLSESKEQLKRKKNERAA
jgi:hypothetical protein